MVNKIIQLQPSSKKGRQRIAGNIAGIEIWATTSRHR